MQNFFILFLVLKLNICNELSFKINTSSQRDNDTYINQKLYSNKNFNKNKNVILGIIEKYSFKTILPFFKSIIHSNFQNCDIVIFVRKVSQTTINYLKGIGVIIYQIPKIYKKISIVKLRWKMYIVFLKDKRNEYNLVLSADVRDTFFQKDVFKYYENHEPFLGISIEDGTLEEEFNKRWIIDYVGEEKYKTVQNERIICAGSIWGTLDKFLEFSEIIWDKLLIHLKTTDQGILNYLFYSENLFKEYIVKSDNYGPIMTVALTESKNIILDKDDNILNFKGEVASVIHQYDRKKDIKIKVINKYCPELLIFNEFNIKLNIANFISILELFVIIIIIKSIFKKKKYDK